MMNSIEGKYQAFPSVDILDRSWPNKRITKPPIWCSVDLRDGNQSLINPMDIEQKLRMFETLRAIGFTDIEIGFPSASETEYSFVRRLLQDGYINDRVIPQVLTQARPHLIDKTFEALDGFPRATVHLYNSTSEVQRRVVFGKDRQGVIDIARRGAAQIRDLVDRSPDTDFVLQYSPESFSGTELDFALEICAAVTEIWEPSVEKPIIINLPSTVEMSLPNIFADQIEYMHRHLTQRDSIILSIHPHNDRGTAVASAELALLAGGQRIEGTLFGNGERTGNVDIVTLALNMFTQGVNPDLDFSNITSIRKTAEYCTEIPVHQRHPYAGDLVFTAFSGSHQDAIRKGIDARRTSNNPLWEVPYLPVDPADLGRNYEPIIRVNSQSGKGGIAFIMEEEFKLEMPRSLQIEFANLVQEHNDASGIEIKPKTLWDLFCQHYLLDLPLSYNDHKLMADRSHEKQFSLTATISLQHKDITLVGNGNGPLDAFLACINNYFGLAIKIKDYHQHAIGGGATANSATYLEMQAKPGHVTYGIGLHQNILLASLLALTHGINRMNNLGWISLKSPANKAK